MNWLIQLFSKWFGKSLPTENPPPVSAKEPVSIQRTVSSDGLALIKKFEGLYLTAYKDPVGIWTIGYGYTGIKHNDGTVKKGQRITKQKAEDLLAFDLNTKYGPAVNRLVKVPLLQREFDALISFHFNTGALGESTLLKKLNAGDREGAANEFLRWDKAGGKVLRGLTRRRKAERAMFLGQDWEQF